MLSTELHRRTSLTPDGRPEKGGETPGRTTSKVLEFRHPLLPPPTLYLSLHLLFDLARCHLSASATSGMP